MRRATRLLILFAVLFVSRDALAYPWMIRHGYTNCATCHADPSGGGLVTAYGRAQGELLLRTHYTGSEEEEPGRVARFAYGTIPLPDNLLLEAVSRSGEVKTVIPGAPSIKPIFVQMQADLRGQLTAGHFRVNGSIAFAQTGARADAITTKPDNNVISREHWIGWDVTGSVLVRAGRFQLPYGVRDIEHQFWVRSATRSDGNEQQTDGVSVGWSFPKWRGEIMGIAGNYQVRPDEFRERGYSGYVEFAAAPTVAVGYSSLYGTSQVDLVRRIPLQRQAHGAFLRAAPWKPIVILAEEDLLIEQPRKGEMTTGSAGMVQLDAELFQGVHIGGTAEHLVSPIPGSGRSIGYWGTINWFFASHADVRLDVVETTVATPKLIRATTIVGQFHYYL